MIYKAINIVRWVNVKNKLYFKSYRSAPGLFCYDLSLKKLSLITEPTEMYSNWAKYNYGLGVGRVNKYVVFAPYFAKKFIVLNTENMEVSCFDNKKSAKYAGAVEYKDKLIIFAEKITDSVVFDSRTFLFEYPFSTQSSSIVLRMSACVNRKGSRVIIPIQCKDCIVEIDLELYSVNIKFLVKLDIVYNIVVLYRDKYIFTGDKPLIVIWDGENKVETLKLDRHWMRPKTIPWLDLFFNAVIKENKIFFCPWNYKILVSLNLMTKEIEYLYELKEKEYANMNELPEGLLLSIVEDEIPKGNCLYRYDGNIVDCMDFEFKDEFKLPGTEIEYSRRALQYFIDDLIS